VIYVESPDDGYMKIESLDEHPEEVCDKQVVEERHQQLTQTLNITISSSAYSGN